MTVQIPSWCDRIPKVEIHLHLEGAIPLPALWQLVQNMVATWRSQTLLPYPISLCSKIFRISSKPGIWKNQFIREYEDFTFIAEAVAHDWPAEYPLRRSLLFAGRLCRP